jgi:hypothetical protein
MSPRIALGYVANIREAFIRLDQAGAATYRCCVAADGDRHHALMPSWAEARAPCFRSAPVGPLQLPGP